MGVSFSGTIDRIHIFRGEGEVFELNFEIPTRDAIFAHRNADGRNRLTGGNFHRTVMMVSAMTVVMVTSAMTVVMVSAMTVVMPISMSFCKSIVVFSQIGRCIGSRWKS